MSDTIPFTVSTDATTNPTPITKKSKRPKLPKDQPDQPPPVTAPVQATQKDDITRAFGPGTGGIERTPEHMQMLDNFNRLRALYPELAPPLNDAEIQALPFDKLAYYTECLQIKLNQSLTDRVAERLFCGVNALVTRFAPVEIDKEQLDKDVVHDQGLTYAMREYTAVLSYLPIPVKIGMLYSGHVANNIKGPKRKRDAPELVADDQGKGSSGTSVELSPAMPAMPLQPILPMSV
jgi:hypothetical protein